MNGILLNYKKGICIQKACFKFFKTRQVIMAFPILTLTHKMTRNERFNMIGLSGDINILMVSET